MDTIPTSSNGKTFGEAKLRMARASKGINQPYESISCNTCSWHHSNSRRQAPIKPNDDEMNVLADSRTCKGIQPTVLIVVDLVDSCHQLCRKPPRGDAVAQ